MVKKTLKFIYMKGSRGLALFLLVLSIISGYLMSKASLVSRAGMSLFYRQYNFLKVWWKGGLLIIVALTALYFLHRLIQKKVPFNKIRTFHIIACVLALTGLYFTYNDFRHTLSHRLLGERFHIGVYLFWIGWITICLYFLTNRKQLQTDQLLIQQDTVDHKTVD